MASDAEIIAEWEAAHGGYKSPSDAELLAEWEAVQPKRPSIWSETRGVANRGIQGVADLIGFAAEANPFQTGGPFNLFRDPARTLIREKVGDAPAILQGAARDVGLLTEQTPQTAVGKLLGETAYYAPSLAVPGGAGRMGVASVLGAGTASGIADIAGADEETKSLAGLAGGLIPNAVQIGRAATGRLVGKAAETQGRKMLRKSIGARSSDYVRSADDLRLYDVSDDEVETITKRILDEVLEKQELGKSVDPAKMLRVARDKGRATARDIGKAVGMASQDLKEPVVPEFRHATAYITEGNVPADEMDSYLGKLKSFAESIKEKGKGSLEFLQKQKVTWGKLYEEGNDIKNGYYKAVYNDLKETLENNVPGLRSLNKEEQKWIVTNKILKRSLGLEESSSLDASALAKIRTSGGIGSTFAPAAALTAAGGALAGSPVIAMGGLLAFANTNKGRQVIGRALLKAGKGAREAAITLDNLPVVLQALGRASTAGLESDSRALESESLPPRAVPAGDVSQSQSQEILNRTNGFGARRINTPPTGLQPLRLNPSQIPVEILSQLPQRQLGLESSDLGLKSSAPLSNVTDSFPPTQPTPLDLALNQLESQGENMASDLTNLVNAVSYVESRGKAGAVSPKGAVGIMQIMPATAKEIASELGYETYNLKDPTTNKIFGEHYLRKLLNLYGDLPLALAAYNGGPGRVSRLLSKYNATTFDQIARYLPKETREYVPMVLSRLDKLEGIVEV